MNSWSEFERAEPHLAASGIELLKQRDDQGLLATVAADGTPRIHPLNVGVRDGRLLVFVQRKSAKARDLEANPGYALHSHVDAQRPHEFQVRGHARRVTDAGVVRAAAGDWYFSVPDDYPLYELLVDHVLLGERDSAEDWPPRYRSWRSGR